MKSTVIIAAAVLAFSSMGMWAPDDASKGVPDTKLGLSKTSVFDAPTPEATKPNTSDPGDLPLPERGSSEEPPVIPHGVGDYLPITLSENQCAECHVIEGEKEPDEPTPVPKSHYVDFRNAPSTTQDKLVGARYNCVSCHVVPGNNNLLVGNAFSRSAGR